MHILFVNGPARAGPQELNAGRRRAINILSTIVNDPLVLLIPIFAAIIGWGTNVIAVKMMFSPIDFFGIKPWFGWQGIIPANAAEMAATSTEIITTKLLNLRMLFANFDPKDFSGNLDAAMDEITEEIISQTAAKYATAMWDGLPDAVKDQVRQMVRVEVNQVTVNILGDMSESIDEIIDLKAIVMEEVHKNKALIGDMFATVGVEEFKFIKRSGAYFGFLFGIVQLFAWLLYPAWWVLPLFGFLVGYITNWLALKLIFEPAEPKKIGPFVFHGLFHKRQQIVAKEFAAMVSRDILNPANIVAKMTSGKYAEKLFGIVDKHIGALVEKYKENPMTKSMVPDDQWGPIKEELFARVREDLPKPGGFLDVFTSRAVDVFGELFGRMSQLDSESFEGVLRPAFQKDEWKLIVAGAVLGLAAGVLQVVYLFKGSLG